MTRISTHLEDLIDEREALAELYAEHGIVPLSLETDLMREGVFLHLPNHED